MTDGVGVGDTVGPEAVGVLVARGVRAGGAPERPAELVRAGADGVGDVRPLATAAVEADVDAIGLEAVAFDGSGAGEPGGALAPVSAVVTTDE